MVRDLKNECTSACCNHFHEFVISFAINRLIKIKEWVDKNDPGAVLIPFSGVFENKILDMDEAERAKYFEEHKVTRSVSPRGSVITIINFYPPLNVAVSRSQMRGFDGTAVVYRRLKNLEKFG